MRDDLNGFGVDLFGSVGGLSDGLFPDGVEEPEVHVAGPESLLFDERDLGNGPLVNVADSVLVSKLFFEPDIVKPEIVMERIPCEFLYFTLLSVLRLQKRIRVTSS